MPYYKYFYYISAYYNKIKYYFLFLLYLNSLKDKYLLLNKR